MFFFDYVPIWIVWTIEGLPLTSEVPTAETKLVHSAHSTLHIAHCLVDGQTVKSFYMSKLPFLLHRGAIIL